jgi:hypothetical protein
VISTQIKIKSYLYQIRKNHYVRNVLCAYVRACACVQICVGMVEREGGLFISYTVLGLCERVVDSMVCVCVFSISKVKQIRNSKQVVQVMISSSTNKHGETERNEV